MRGFPKGSLSLVSGSGPNNATPILKVPREDRALVVEDNENLGIVTTKDFVRCSDSRGGRKGALVEHRTPPHGYLDDIPPAEYEKAFYDRKELQTTG